MQNLHFIKDEMLSHVPICTHANPKKVLIIGGCDNLKREVEKHKTIETIDRIDAQGASDLLANLVESHYDVIINAAEGFGQDKIFWGLLNRTLASKGVVSTLSSRLLTQKEAVRGELGTIGELFKIVMPYRYEALEGEENLTCHNLILASHSYHPTADINLQRADLTEGFSYYNSDIAIGTFQLPTIVRKEFLGLVKL